MGCPRHLQGLQVVQERHQGEGLVLLTVSMDDPSVYPKIPEFLKKRGIRAKVLLGNPQAMRGYDTHPACLYVIDRQGFFARMPEDDSAGDLEKSVEARLPDLLAGKPTPGPLLMTMEKAPSGFGLYWRQPLDSPATALGIAPSSKGHPAEIGLATESSFLRYAASGELLSDMPLEGEKPDFLRGVDLDGDGKNDWIAAGGSVVSLLDGAGEEYWKYVSYQGSAKVAAVMDLNGDGSWEIVIQDGPSIVARKVLSGFLWKIPPPEYFLSVVPDPSGVLLAQTRDGIQALDDRGRFRGRPMKAPANGVLKGRIVQGKDAFIDVFCPEQAVVDVRHDLDGDGRKDILVSVAGSVSVYAQDGSPLLILRVGNDVNGPAAALENLDDRPGDEIVLAIPRYGLVALGIAPQAKPIGAGATTSPTGISRPSSR